MLIDLLNKQDALLEQQKQQQKQQQQKQQAPPIPTSNSVPVTTPSPTIAQLASQWSLEALRAACKENVLRTFGTKHDLIERLLDAGVMDTLQAEKV